MTSIVVPRRTAPGPDLRARLAGLVRDRADEAPWVRFALPALAVLAAVVYTLNLTLNGYANSYYTAAALAGSHSWSAWFFGQLKAYVASGRLRYIVLGGGGGAGGSTSSSDLSARVTSVGTVVDYGGSGTTLYDLSGALAAAS